MDSKRFRQLSRFIDYDRQYLHELTPKQEVIYFEKRLRLVLVGPLRKMHRTLMREKHHDSILCFGTCICCSIEALGKFFSGELARDKSGHNFEAFVKEFMSNDFLQTHNGVPYVTLLWKNFRNGLAHGFTIRNGGYEISKTRQYFAIKPIGGIDQLMIDPTLFYEDFMQAVDNYLSMLKSRQQSDPTFIRFQHSFRGVFVLGL